MQLDKRFTTNELNAIMDACNGCFDILHSESSPFGDPARIEPCPGAYIGINVQDTPHLDAKWDIDRQALIRKINALDVDEARALQRAIQLFWESPNFGIEDALVRTSQ